MRKNGFVGLIVIVVIGIIILSIFNVSIRELLNKPVVKDNFFYVWNGIKHGVSYIINLL